MRTVTRLTSAMGGPYHFLRGEVRGDWARTVCGRTTRWPFPIAYRIDIPLCTTCRKGAERAGDYRSIARFPNYGLARPATDAVS